MGDVDLKRRSPRALPAGQHGYGVGLQDVHQVETEVVGPRLLLRVAGRVQGLVAQGGEVVLGAVEGGVVEVPPVYAVSR